MTDGDRSLAIFIDFENLALGFQGRRDRFEISRVLERLVEKGKIVAKKAYADWSRFGNYTAPLHESAIELVEIPRRGQSGKNSADIRLCVDAMDLAYSKEHIDTFVVVSGDSDFSPLVSKLKELGKHVIGLGMQDSTSDLLRDNCDEFIYYEDLGQAPPLTPALDSRLPETKRKAFALLIEALQALRRESKELLWSSMIKDTMKRKKPSLQRGVPRLPHVQRIARRRGAGRAAGAGDGQAQPHLRGDALRCRNDGAAPAVCRGGRRVRRDVAAQEEVASSAVVGEAADGRRDPRWRIRRRGRRFAASGATRRRSAGTPAGRGTAARRSAFGRTAFGRPLATQRRTACARRRRPVQHHPRADRKPAADPESRPAPKPRERRPRQPRIAEVPVPSPTKEPAQTAGR